MKNEARHTAQDMGQVPQEPLPVLAPTLRTALVTASEEISEAETWVPPFTDRSMSTIPRLMAVIFAASRLLSPAGRPRHMLRAKSVRILAYLPADLRLSAVISIARRDPDALDDLFTGPVPDSHEIYRYNLLSSLGIFARHGLVEEVFTQERVRDVGKVVDDVRKSSSGNGRR